ncbi:MAG: hypothetical protein RL026_1776 [Pseudomonadota bacterium]|jgi:septum formation protein
MSSAAHHPAVLLLASASPRRRELLAQIGVAHEVRPTDVDESPRPGEVAEALVQRLACAKAEAGLAAAGDRPVLGADTIVVLGGRVLGKPRDRAEGLAMLQALSGRRHRVLSAVALACRGWPTQCRLSVSEVSFRAITTAEAEAYWASGEPVDKAGGYAIQGRAAVFIEDLHGSYSGVMGLPLFETAELLAGVGLGPAGDHQP